MKKARQSRRTPQSESGSQRRCQGNAAHAERFPKGGGWRVSITRGPRQRAAFPSNLAKRDTSVADLKAAAERNKAFVWGEYENQRSKLSFAHDDAQCPNKGVAYTATASKLARNQLPCGCNRRAAAACRALDITVPKKLAESRDGALLSTEYLNNRLPLKWRCADGHRFAMSLSDAQSGRWCPRCSNSQANTLCAVALKELLGVTFEPEATPDFLRDASEINGLRGFLRFDGWCESERIGFEHQGPQHGRPLTHYRVSGPAGRAPDAAKAKFLKGQRYDAIKAAACIEEATLIVIPDISADGYAFPRARFIVETVVTAVRTALPPERLDAGFEAAVERLAQIDAEAWTHLIKPIFAGSRVHRRLREHAEALGGRVINFVDDRHAKMECGRGHQWTAQINNILGGNWCPVEGRQARARARRLSIGTLRMRLQGIGLRLNWSNDEARAHYKNNQTPIPVTREACGGSFTRPLSKLHGGSRCPECKGKAHCSGGPAKAKSIKKLH